MSEEKIFRVLFLCTENSARSIMAERIMNRLGQGRFRAVSVGSQPRGQGLPYTIDLLTHLNHQTEELRSKSWEEFSGRSRAPDHLVPDCSSRRTGRMP